ncbi:MAG: O-antigen ligase family protein [Pyrinomonadaceae bacterium]
MNKRTGAEQWFYLAFVASLPFPSVLHFYAGSFPITLPDLLFVAAAAAWAVAWLTGRRALAGGRIYAFMAGYAIAVALATIFSADPARSAVKLVGKFYLIGIALLTFNSISAIGDLRRTVIAWLVGAGIAVAGSFAGIIAFYAGLTDPSVNLVLHPIFGSLPSGNYRRIDGFFFYPAMFCNFLGITWMLAVMSVSLGWIRARVFRVFSPVMWIVNFFTLTPGLGGAFLSTALFLRNDPSRKRLPAAVRLITTMGGVLIAGAFFIAAAVTLFSYGPNGTQVPLKDGAVAPSHRAVAWRTAVGTFMENPVFGYGLGLGVAEAEYIDPSGSRQLLVDAHNTYISVLAETGIIGFLAFMSLIGFVTLGLYFWRTETGDMGRIRLCFLLALADAFFYQSLTGSYEDARHLWVFIAVAAAVSGRVTFGIGDDGASGEPDAGTRR